MKFSLMLKRGNKPQIKELAVPADSLIAVSVQKHMVCGALRFFSCLCLVRMMAFAFFLPLPGANSTQARSVFALTRPFRSTREMLEICVLGNKYTRKTDMRKCAWVSALAKRRQVTFAATGTDTAPAPRHANRACSLNPHFCCLTPCFSRLRSWRNRPSGSGLCWGTRRW